MPSVLRRRTVGSGPRAAGAGQSGAARASASPASHPVPVPGCLCLSPGPQRVWESTECGRLIVLSNAGPERAGSDLQLSSRRLGAPILGFVLFIYAGGALHRLSWRSREGSRLARGANAVQVPGAPSANRGQEVRRT